MALISSLITEVRVDINDSDSTRFTTDTPILAVFKKAIRRANRICQRNGVQFAKKKAALTTVTSQTYVDISTVTDFDVFIGLFRDSDHTEIRLVTERDWELLVSPDVLTKALIDQANSKICLAGTPTAAEALTLWYYPTVDPSAYTTASSTPWSGRLDDILVEYVSLRLKNIDEMEASFDQALLNDMENQIVSAYVPNSSNYEEGSGWLGDMG